MGQMMEVPEGRNTGSPLPFDNPNPLTRLNQTIMSRHTYMQVEFISRNPACELVSATERAMKSLKAVALFFLLVSLLSPLSAFAQVKSQKMHSASAGERDEDQPQKRAQWNMRGRIAPKGESAAALRLRAYQQKMAMRAQRAAEAQRAGALAPPPTTWVSRGPSPLASDATGNGFQDYSWVSGRATSVLVDPADATGNTVFLGGAYGGLWKSTNAGSKSATPDLVTWQALIDDQPSLAVGAIALEPGNSNIILVGTGEANSSGDSYYGMGILRSTDGGTTWTQIKSAASGESFLGIGFSKMAFSTSNTNLVVASTAGDIGFDFGLEQSGSSPRGLYYSTDAGATWHRVTLADSAVPASATGVVFNPKQGANGTFYAAIRRHGIYSSTDGTTFTRLPTQPIAGLASANCPAASNSPNCPLYRAEFAVTPGVNETYVWIVDVQSSEVDNFIWRTTDGGAHWTQIPDNGITNCFQGGDSGGDGGCGVSQGAYNLELAAVPGSPSGTDLYAGTINIYKCHLASGTASSCSTIDANVPNDWINLTHVYGCANTVLGALAHVHPDQHGLAFMVASSKAPGYFAHDGGISRTLDGYAGLKSGSCTGHNQFDSLAQTLGSMSEFVSFSVHPTSADTMVGGTQDNGSPKTATATTSTTWQNALSGDGGYNAINQSNRHEWFTSNPFSDILKCQGGSSCDDNGQYYVASARFIGNIDFGAFYTPFILDPKNSGEMLIGTCRMWRGDTATGTNNIGFFSPLSVNFDTLDGTRCNGGEVNQVAGLAAGGPPDGGGFSNVIYATTWGYGPFAGIGGGEVWVTTNAATTPLSNVTGSTINPNHYAISSVAIDNSDATGNTAYVGIMGFHASHVWKTTDAGGTGLVTDWTDWTGTGLTALPDNPVSALFVDSANGIIYAGTDVGVFSSPTTGAGGVWTEVGPVASPGAVGFLPSAPVTAIQMFTAGCGSGELRVSTYGRGIWDYPKPDFCAAISDTPQTVLKSQTATLNGTLTAFGSYNSAVTLTCGAGAPGACTFNPSTPITATTAGVPFTVTVSSGTTIKNYTFNIHATDGTISHDFSVTVNVTDFSEGVPSPASITAVQGQTSNATQSTIGSLGPFNGYVTLACSGLPTGASCNFSPSSVIPLYPLNPSTNASVTVTTSASTPIANGTVITLSATTDGEAAKNQTFTLNVTVPPPDFTIAVTATPNSTLANQNVQWSGNLTALNGYNKPVTLSCTAGAPGTCTFSPSATMTPTAAPGTSFTATVGSNTAATYNFTISGTDAASLTHATPTETLTVSQDFSVPSTLVDPPAANPGQVTSTTMLISPVGGATFAGNVTFAACTGLPSGLSCTYSPTQIASGSNATTVTISVQTAGPFTGTAGAARPRMRAQKQRLWLPLSLPLAGLVLVGLVGRRWPRRYKIVGLCLALTVTGFLVACGGGSSPPPPVVTVSPSSVNTLYPSLAGAPAQTKQFSAMVSNTSSQSVTWAVTGSANGTIDANGLYTSPATLPTPNSPLTRTATSTAAGSPGSATVNLQVPTAPFGPGQIVVPITEGAATHSPTFNLTVN